MLHIAKLAVGIRDVAHLREVQQRRIEADPPLRHQTRNAPRRRDEVLDGGSLYWVVAGAMVVRQRILDIRPAQWEDGTACAALILDPELVAVAGRLTRAFQGWRYLEADAAPADILAGAEAGGADALPPAMLRDLQRLGLL